MLDFLKWRGDLPLSVSPLGEVDQLIFSQLAYLHFRDALGEGAAPLHAAARRVEALPREPGNAQLVANRHTLLEAAAGCKRYGNLSVAFCEDRFDTVRGMQFAAVTFTLADGAHLLAYRGTDATVVGWREDFNMSFACPVPAQTEAVGYLTEVAEQTTGPLLLCGHSKGGNLALYAAACCQEVVRNRIRMLHLFDAPGLDQATLAMAGYRDVLPRVRCYIPQTSIIGRLMGVPETYTVVRSTATGIAQHNPFTWALDGPRLETLPALDQASNLIKATLDDFLSDSTPETRQMLVDTLFQVVGSANTHTFGEMAERWTDTAGAVWDALRSLDGGTLKATLSVVGGLASSGVESAKKYLLATREPSDGNEPKAK